MMDFDYDLIPLNAPERLASGVILGSPVAYRYRLTTLHRHAVIREEQISHNWIADRYARGCWLRSVPGQVRWLQELADMLPPVPFAGGDLFRGFYGWMGGAMTLGRDVATGIMARARDDNVSPTTG